MLKLRTTLVNTPILSLRTGGSVATSTGEIINPNNLKIEGLFCQDRFEKKQLILVALEIREILANGIVVNDHEVLSEEEDLIRLKELIELRFELVGKAVYTESKQRIGKVVDYAFDDQSLYIQKLYVARSILKSLNTGQLSVDRNEIIEITNKKIIVKDILRPAKAVPIPSLLGS